MALEKIKIDEVTYECFVVNYKEEFSAIIKNDSVDEIEAALSSANSITIMNSIGQILKTITDIGEIKSITKIPDYYYDENDEKMAVVHVVLKTIDLNSKVKALEAKLNTSINEAAMSLDEYKEYRIGQSKIALEEYLDANPITSTAHGGKEGIYSITKEKQDLMSQQYLTYQIMKTVDLENAVLTWNERGGVCEPWTEEEFVQLVMEIKARVYPLVSYQQYLEKQIRDSIDKAEIAAMTFDYDNAVVVVNE